MKRLLIIFFPLLTGYCHAQMLYTVPAISTATVPQGMAISTVPSQGIPAQSPALPEKIQPLSPPKEFTASPISLSGMVLMPTAYRGAGKNTIGLSLDFNTAYYIGRLYGANKLDWTIQKTNYMDRVGVWLIMVDGKMLVQTESKWRPAMAAGVMGVLYYRDAQQAGINTSLNFTLQSGQTQKSNNMSSAYVVFSKRPHPKFITSLGYMEGNTPDILPMLSEFLSRNALRLSGHPDQSATSRNMLFGGFTWLVKPNFPLGAEILIPQGAPAKPKLINFQLGRLIKLDFEVSLLTFEGGWDLLGMVQFRYTSFPRK